ncbi:MAG: T9SS type A sorting domain-containing protein [Flavobacteriales bacterium]|nr:T9SS type A sorting domain-containing protein [Flavobacteriales bacterium]
MSPSVTRWDGSAFHTLGCGLHGGTWDCITPGNGGSSSPTTDLEFWNGELYACGTFTHSGQTELNRVARWDGQAWQPLGTGADGTVSSLRAGPDGLYAGGLFNQMDTITALGLARWDGTRWHRVHDLPDITPVQGTNSIFDLAFYNGMLYIAGNFKGSLGNSIARWNGSAWEGLPGGALFAGSYSWINRLEVHDGLLYAAGVFSRDPPDGHPDNPGNSIAAFDGSTWTDLAGGTAGSASHQVNELLWWHDTLYVAGSFNAIGGIPSGGLARWDGQRWCSLVPPGYFDLPTRAIGLFRDSLHIGGIFTTAGADSVYRVGVWTGGSTTSGCGPVGVQEEPTVTATTSLTAWPNPATDRVQVSGAPASARIELIDPLGRVVRRTTSEPAPLWVGDLPRGLYTIVVHERNGALHGRVRVRLDP